jgi:hypothetical protein
MQLAHAVGGIAAIYNQAKYVPERRALMTAWANYLDGVRKVTTSSRSSRLQHERA